VQQEESMIRVAKLGHSALQVRDLDAAVAYHRDVLGLAVSAQDESSAHLTSGLDFSSVVLRTGPDDRILHNAFQLDPSVALQDAAKALRDAGCEASERTDPDPGIAELVEFTDPSGNVVQLYAATAAAPGGAPDGSGGGILPHKLGHVCLLTDDVPGLVTFYQDVLGFRWSDWMGDFFAFIRCGSDHHTMNFMRSRDVGRMHHIAFELNDWDHVKKACDRLGAAGIPLLWGPGRHGPGHNVFTYHRAPDGSVVELFCELDRMADEGLGYFEPRPWHEDNPQRPKVWEPSPQAANAWGVPPPEWMLAP
jgi:catechol 2,3-dioxygenase-like lactoylglutathione lyase family enzyme